MINISTKSGVIKMTQTVPSGKKIRYIVLTGLFAALIYLFTSIFKIPTGNGYTHAGDGLIFLAASSHALRNGSRGDRRSFS